MKKKKAKFVYEAMGDVLKPKSEEEIEKNLENVYDQIAMDLLDDDYFDDYLNAFEFAEKNSNLIRDFITFGMTIKEISYALMHGLIT